MYSLRIIIVIIGLAAAGSAELALPSLLWQL